MSSIHVYTPYFLFVSDFTTNEIRLPLREQERDSKTRQLSYSYKMKKKMVKTTYFHKGIDESEQLKVLDTGASAKIVAKHLAPPPRSTSTSRRCQQRHSRPPPPTSFDVHRCYTRHYVFMA